MKLTFSLDHLPGSESLPVRCESLHADMVDGAWRVANAPFFVQDLACGDLIKVVEMQATEVRSWQHIERSANSTVWLLATRDVPLKPLADALRDAGCQVEGLPQLNLCSVNVPPTVTAATLDALLADASGLGIEVAYPAWRHPDA